MKSYDELQNRTEKPLLVIGAGGMASNVFNVAQALNRKIAYFIHDKKADELLFNVKILSSLSAIESIENYEIFIAIGDNYLRKKNQKKIASHYPKLEFPSLIHPSVDVGFFTSIGLGSIIMPNSVIGANSIIEDFSIIGNLSCVGHDSIVGAYSSLSPGAILAGNVKIGSCSMIGLGARVTENVNVGNNSIVGANSLLNHNLDNNTIAYGTPAQVKRIRKHDDPYLK